MKWRANLYEIHWNHYATCDLKPLHSHREDLRSRFEAAIHLETEEEKLKFLSNLHLPAALAGIIGANAILAGDVRGWSWIDLSRRFYFVGQQVAVARFEYERSIVEMVRDCKLRIDSRCREILRLLDFQKPPISLSTPLDKLKGAPRSPFRPKAMFPSDEWMQTLLLSIIFGNEDYFHWALSLMQSSHPAIGHDWLDEPLWAISYYACCLRQKDSGMPPTEHRRMMGKVEKLFDEWLHPEKFAMAFLEIANIAAAARRKALSPVNAHPCPVFPVEILAIIKIRSDLGLVTLPLEHPIAETPLFHMPDKIEPMSDELFDTVNRVIRQVFPEFCWIWTLQSSQAASLPWTLA